MVVGGDSGGGGRNLESREEGEKFLRVLDVKSQSPSCLDPAKTWPSFGLMPHISLYILYINGCLPKILLHRHSSNPFTTRVWPKKWSILGRHKMAPFLAFFRKLKSVCETENPFTPRVLHYFLPKDTKKACFSLVLGCFP